MTATSDAAIAIVLEEEGVFSDDARDPGGETMYGLSRAAHPGLPWPPTIDQARAEYLRVYWTPHRCEEMPWGWALALFDGCVNQTGRAVRLAQLALQTVEDGEVGPETLAAMQGPHGGDRLLTYLALRADAYLKSPNYDVFGHGWLRRLMRIAQCGEHPPVP